MWRQGDLLIVAVNEIPRGAAPKGDRVLAEGEATGHRHRLEEGELLQTVQGDLFMKLMHASRVVHEEHGPIGLGAGTYRVIRQREFTDEAARIVAD